MKEGAGGGRSVDCSPYEGVMSHSQIRTCKCFGHCMWRSLTSRFTVMYFYNIFIFSFCISASYSKVIKVGTMLCSQVTYNNI